MTVVQHEKEKWLLDRRNCDGQSELSGQTGFGLRRGFLSAWKMSNNRLHDSLRSGSDTWLHQFSDFAESHRRLRQVDCKIVPELVRRNNDG